MAKDLIPYRIQNIKGSPKKIAEWGQATIFCRSEKSAKNLYREFFGTSFNPNNLSKGKVTKQGHLIIRCEHRKFKVSDFWARHGFYPVLIINGFFNKSKYDKWVSNAQKFILDL